MYEVGDTVKLVKIDYSKRGISPGYVAGMVDDCRNDTVFVICSLPGYGSRYIKIANIDRPKNYQWMVREEWITPYYGTDGAEEVCISTVLGVICSV